MYSQCDLVNTSHTQVKVNRVHVQGLKRTKSDIVVEHVKDVLSARNLLELFRKSEEASERLEALNIFKRVTIELDAKKRSKERGGKQEKGGMVKGEGERGLEVTFRVKESGRIKSTIGAEAGTQSGGAVSQRGRGHIGGGPCSDCPAPSRTSQ